MNIFLSYNQQDVTFLDLFISTDFYRASVEINKSRNFASFGCNLEIYFT